MKVKVIVVNESESKIILHSPQVPTGWYPAPRIVWYKGGVELTPSVRVFPLEFDVGGETFKIPS